MKKIFIYTIALLILSPEVGAKNTKNKNLTIHEFIKRSWKDEILDEKDKTRIKLIEPVVSAYYKKRIGYKGIYIKGGAHISDLSLVKSYAAIERMLIKRADISNRLAKKKVEIALFGAKEDFCSLPETRNQITNKTFDDRTVCDLCGGSFAALSLAAVCEINVVKSAEDPFRGKTDVMTHEFAHLIYGIGLEKKEIKQIQKIYKNAKKQNIFIKDRKGNTTYVMQNDLEFFAVLSGVWFGVHDVHTSNHTPDLIDRESIRNFLPEMYTMLVDIYGE